MEKYTDEGLIRLAIAIIQQAREEYNKELLELNGIQASFTATIDSKGIVGDILDYALHDREYFIKDINKRRLF